MVKYVEECLAHGESSVDVGDATAADKTIMMVTMTMTTMLMIMTTMMMMAS